MHLFGVMFHGGPVRLGEEWGGPSEIEVILTGINPLVSLKYMLKMRAKASYGQSSFVSTGQTQL